MERGTLNDDTFEEGVRLREEEGLSIAKIMARLGGTRGWWEIRMRNAAVFKRGRPPKRLPRLSEHDHTIERMRLAGENPYAIGRAIGKPPGYVNHRLRFMALRQAAIDAYEEMGVPPPEMTQAHTSRGGHHEFQRP